MTRNLFYFFVSLLVFTGIVSCSSDPSKEFAYGSIAGSVSDATTGEPVPTVNVTLSPGGNQTVTGSDGSFTFNNLEAREYSIKISKEGYKSNSAQFIVRNGESISAHLLIERSAGIVKADRQTLNFGDNQSLNTLSFNIVNSGYEDLEWEIEERCDWITEIKPAKGVLPYGKTEGIVVVIDRNLLEPGKNTAIIVIRSSEGSSQMYIEATGTNKALPKLNVSAATNITSSSATLNGEIANDGEPPYTERGFVFSMNPVPTLENTISKLTCPVNTTAKFSYTISELK